MGECSKEGGGGGGGGGGTQPAAKKARTILPPPVNDEQQPSAAAKKARTTHPPSVIDTTGIVNIMPSFYGQSFCLVTTAATTKAKGGQLPMSWSSSVDAAKLTEVQALFLSLSTSLSSRQLR